MLAAMLHGTTAKAGTKCVSTNFHKAENDSAPGEVLLWGHRADAQTGGQTLTKEASIEGRFRFAGKKPGPW
jgi:hypothetical protein